MDITPSLRNNRHLVIFRVAPYVFCAPATEVESFIMPPPVSRLPKAPPSVTGVINHRGQVYRVIALRFKLGLDSGPRAVAGQLILTQLSTGPTAFLVDEITDVLPDTDLIRRPLHPQSPMDLFDAFVLKDEEILFHTSFEQLEQAEEIPYPNPDLKTAVENLAPAKAGMAREKEIPPASDGNGAGPAAPLEGSGRTSSRSEAALFEKAKAAVAAATPRKTPRTQASPKAMDKAPASRRRPTAAPSAGRPRHRTARARRRTRRLALALMGILLMLLVVVFSSVWLVQNRLMTGDRPTAPSAATTETTDTARPLPRNTQDASQQPPGMERPPEATGREAEEATPAPPASPDTPPADPEEAPAATQEVLRLETESFTLLVERPSGDATALPKPPTRSATAASGNTITHVVVAGDTLWDIAGYYLGDPFQYPELARVSRIRDPDLIYPGDIIYIIMKS